MLRYYLMKKKQLFIESNIRVFSSELKTTISDLIPTKRTEMKFLKENYSNHCVDNVSVNQVLGGMRGIKSMIWDNSSLDPEKGITFHDKTIQDLREQLPKFYYSSHMKLHTVEPMMESMLWFLMTGQIPTNEQVKMLTNELHNNSKLSETTRIYIENLPKNMHPMTKLSSSILMLQPQSQFVKKYNEGVSKQDYWESTYDDVISIIAKLPEICSIIYKNTYDKSHTIEYNERLDYTSNFCNMMGFSDMQFHELMRLYLLIHSDHEGGNASAHTCRLVGSTLSDPYLSLASCMNALAGPLHGLANQEVLNWILELKNDFDKNGRIMNDKNVKEYAWKMLNDGNVIPGYGHAVLRHTDPRYICQREFALYNLKDNELFEIVNILYNVLPGVLTEHGKTKNPYPNVDAHSGVLLHHYGLKEQEFYTVLFGLSRSFGVLSQLMWDRALMLPLERPKSLTIKQLNEICK